MTKQINIEAMFKEMTDNFLIITNKDNQPVAVAIRQRFLDTIEPLCRLKICDATVNKVWGYRNLEAYDDGEVVMTVDSVSKIYRLQVASDSLEIVERQIEALKNYKSKLPLKFITA